MDEMDNCSNALNDHFDDDPDDIDSDYSKCVHKGTNYVPISSKSSNELSQSTSSSIDSSCDSDYYPLNHRIQTNGVGRHNSDYVNTGSPHATQQEPQLPSTPTPTPPPPIYANLPLTGSIASAVNSSATSTVNYPPHHQSPFHRRNHSLNHRFNHKIIINNNNNNNNYHHQHHKNHYHNVITTSSSSSSSSSSYPSSPLSTTCSPPIPETGTDPNRVLLNHWSEYIHLSGRKYYYNSVTKQSSWKPPRRGLPIFRDEEENTSHSEENLTDSSSANSWSPTSNCRDNLSISSDFSSNLNTNSTVNSVYSHRLKPRVRPRKTILGNLWQFDNNKNVDSNTSPYSVPQHRYHLHQQSRINGHHNYADEDSKDTLDQHHHQYHPSFHPPPHHNHHLHNHQHNNAHHHRHHHHQRHNSQDENNPPPPPAPPLLPHHHDTWSSPLPTGWTRYINDNQVYFVNEVTKVKWLCKYDDSGRHYFFEENGDRSYWHLPDIVTDEESDKEWQSQSDASECYSPITKDIPEDSNINSASSFSPAPSVLRFKNDGSLRLPMRKHCYVNGLAPIDRSYRAKSMVFLPTGDKFVNIDSDSEERSSTTTMTAAITTASATSTINKTHLNRNTTAINSSISNNHVNHSLNSHHTHGSHHAKIPPVPENLEESRAFKTGILNRTKIMENGKRLRKNWSTSLVALSDHYLLIFKDAKISSHQEENLKPEIAVELGGSLIEWSQGLSSRKNVFQLTTFTGNQILLQEDCSLTAAEWFYSIKSAISKLPKCDGTATIGSNSLETNKECKLKRSKSTKQTCKKPEINQKLNHSKNGGGGGPGEDKITPEKKKKIRERLINFLLRRPTLDSLREKGIFKDGPVFGCDLYSLCSREKQLVPKVVQQCIKAIEQKGLKADGIYRVCGNLSEVQKIRYQVNHDDYEGIWAQEDVHVLTGALKLFFRDMKEPLFPCNRFDSLMFTIGLPDKKKKQEAIVRVIRDLPKCNKETLKFLLKHLLRVQDHKDENRMHIQNLAIVFGPTLMWPETDSNNLAYDMMLKMHSNQVIELLLLEFDNIFR